LDDNLKKDSSDLWFIAYDIRDPKRLVRVHRYLKRQAIALQYSAFCLEAEESRVLRTLEALGDLIDKGRDDVRAYRLPHVLKVWQLGRQNLPEGVMMPGGKGLMALLRCDQPYPKDAAELLPMV